jgi:hypothetical protein
MSKSPLPEKINVSIYTTDKLLINQPNYKKYKPILDQIEGTYALSGNVYNNIKNSILNRKVNIGNPAQWVFNVDGKQIESNIKKTNNYCSDPSPLKCNNKKWTLTDGDNTLTNITIYINTNFRNSGTEAKEEGGAAEEKGKGAAEEAKEDKEAKEEKGAEEEKEAVEGAAEEAKEEKGTGTGKEAVEGAAEENGTTDGATDGDGNGAADGATNGTTDGATEGEENGATNGTTDGNGEDSGTGTGAAEEEGKGTAEGEGAAEENVATNGTTDGNGEDSGTGTEEGNGDNGAEDNSPDESISVNDPKVIKYLKKKFDAYNSNLSDVDKETLSDDNKKIIDGCIEGISYNSNAERMQKALIKLATCPKFIEIYKQSANETSIGGTCKKRFKTKTHKNKNHKNKKNKTKKTNKRKKINKINKTNKIKYNVKYMTKRHSRKTRHSKRRIRQRGGVFGAAQYNTTLYGSNVNQQEQHLLNGALYPNSEGIAFATAQQGGTRKRGGSLGFVGANIAPATLFATNMFYGKNRRQKTKRRKSNRRRR